LRPGLPVPVTVPAPVPPFVTDSVTGSRLKVAVTEVGAVTVQVPVPEQAPPVQPAKDEPAAAVAVKVRTVPGDTDSEQVAPQLMPAGLLVTVPEPAPLFPTDRVTGLTGRAGTRRPAHDIFALGPAPFTDWAHTHPLLAAPLAWYDIRSCIEGGVTVPCWLPLPSAKPAE